jgi:hypothetical protein
VEDVVTEPPVVEVSRFAVICTDRGQHEPVRIATVRADADGGRSMTDMGHEDSKGVFKAWWTYYDNGTYEFRCPECTRTPQFRRDLWWALVEQTLADGLQRLDLSRLPL